MLRSAFACALVVSAGCTLDFDMVGPKGGGADGGGGVTSVGGDAAGGSNVGASGGGTAGAPEGGAPVNDCSDNGGECAPLPAGFNGAVLLDVGCGSAAKVFDGFQSFTFAPATCGCSCVTPSDNCSLPGNVSAYGSQLCNGNNGTVVISVVGSCIEVPETFNALSIALAGTGTPPICVDDQEEPDIPAIQWGTPIAGCSFQSLGCGSDICLPSAGQRYCFYRDVAGGPIACPDGLTDTPVFQEANVDESRDCECQCGPKIVDGCANPQWGLHSDTSCGALFSSVQSICGDGGGSIGSAEVSIASNVECTQAQAVTGDVKVPATIQACCSPP